MNKDTRSLGMKIVVAAAGLRRWIVEARTPQEL